MTSASWNASLPRLARMVWPVSTIIGTESIMAVNRPVTVLVAPGPRSRAPRRACPCARVAVRHVRGALLVPHQDQLDLGVDERVEDRDGGAPDRPKMYSMPSRSRHWMSFSAPLGTFSAAVMAFALSAQVLARPQQAELEMCPIWWQLQRIRTPAPKTPRLSCQSSMDGGSNPVIVDGSGASWQPGGGTDPPDRSSGPPAAPRRLQGWPTTGVQSGQ